MSAGQDKGEAPAQWPVRLTGVHFDAGESLSAYVEKKFRALAEKYFSLPVEGHIIFTRQRHEIEVELLIHPAAGQSFQAKAGADQARAASDAALTRLAKQLRRAKRRRDHNRKDITPKDKTG